MGFRGSETTSIVLGTSELRTASQANGNKKIVKYEDRKKQFPSLIIPFILSKVGVTKSIKARNAQIVASQRASENNSRTTVKHPTIDSGKERRSRDRRTIAIGLVGLGFVGYVGVQALENNVPSNIVAAYTSFTGGDTSTTTGGENTSGGGSEFEVGQGGTGAGGDEAAAETFVSGKGKNKISCIGELATVKVKKNQPPLTAMTEAGGGIQFDRLKPAVAQQFYDDVIANQEAWGSTADPSKQFVFQPHCEVPAGAYIPN